MEVSQLQIICLQLKQLKDASTAWDVYNKFKGWMHSEIKELPKGWELLTLSALVPQFQTILHLMRGWGSEMISHPSHQTLMKFNQFWKVHTQKGQYFLIPHIVTLFSTKSYNECPSPFFIFWYAHTCHFHIWMPPSPGEWNMQMGCYFNYSPKST